MYRYLSFATLIGLTASTGKSRAACTNMNKNRMKISWVAMGPLNKLQKMTKQSKKITISIVCSQPAHRFRTIASVKSVSTFCSSSMGPQCIRPSGVLLVQQGSQHDSSVVLMSAWRKNVEISYWINKRASWRQNKWFFMSYKYFLGDSVMAFWPLVISGPSNSWDKELYNLQCEVYHSTRISCFHPYRVAAMQSKKGSQNGEDGIHSKGYK